MSDIIQKIQALVADSQTEEALEALIQWLRNQQSYTLNEAILLRARYEQVEKDLSLNLMSPEDASRAFSQINFSLLNLMDNLNKAETLSVAAPSQKKSSKNWIIGIMGVLLAGLTILLLFKIRPADQEGQATAESNQAATSAATTALRFPQGKELKFLGTGNRATYTVLEGTAEKYNSDEQRIIFTIRCYNHKGGWGVNFWDDSFRLLLQDLSYAPKSGLNEVVDVDSFKDGEIYFIIPQGKRAADLKITHYGESAALQVRW